MIDSQEAAARDSLSHALAKINEEDIELDVATVLASAQIEAILALVEALNAINRTLGGIWGEVCTDPVFHDH